MTFFYHAQNIQLRETAALIAAIIGGFALCISAIAILSLLFQGMSGVKTAGTDTLGVLAFGGLLVGIGLLAVAGEIMMLNADALKSNAAKRTRAALIPGQACRPNC